MTEPSPPAAGRRARNLVQRRPYESRARRLHVTSIVDLGPTMRRVMLAGTDLELEFPFTPLASADHVQLCLPDPVTADLAVSRRGELVGTGSPALLRDYTIRRLDPATHELALDFFLHPHGPAGRWGIAAVPGDEVGVIGPRNSSKFPASCADYLLIGDETGLPAVERFLEELPAEVGVRVVVLAGLATAERELGGGRPAEISWLRLADPAAAADSVVPAVADLPVGPDTFVWAAAEASAMRALRRHLRRERGVDANHLAVSGYWRVGAAGSWPAESDPTWHQ